MNNPVYCEVCAKPGANLFPEPVEGKDVYACNSCAELIDKVIVERELAAEAEAEKCEALDGQFARSEA